jgi:hypothetical protein
MGNCSLCKKSGSFNPLTDSGDLPVASLIGVTDPLIRLEKTCVLSRLHVNVFIERINSLGKEQADIPLLAATFNTPAWMGQFDKGTPFYNLITSLPDCSPESIDLGSLSLLALLWCKGECAEKAELLFQQLNPPGQSQASITASDKDWVTVFDRLVYIASYWTQE